MKTILAARASAILYNVLSARDDKRPFILPANICPIVPITFLKARKPFEFVDISTKTLNMDLERVDGLIKTGNYGGLLYAHTYGEPSTPDDFFSDIKKLHPDLLIIDDRCLCPPDILPNPASRADVILYSTGYSKIVDQNHGGFAYISDNLNYQIQILPFHPKDLDELEKSYKKSLEANEPFSYNDSAWLQIDDDVPTWSEFAEYVRTAKESSKTRRLSINAVYNSVIPTSLQLSEPYQLWRFNIRVPNKKKTLDAIFKAQLFASSHFASLAGIMGEGTCPNAEHLAREVINLFNDFHYTIEMAEKTSKTILESL